MTTLLDEIRDHIRTLDRKYYDPLQEFVVQYRIDIARVQLPLLQNKLLETLFELSKTYGIRYLYLGKGELVGCEGIHCGHWPAVWEVARQLGFHSCGNADQYQTNDFKGLYFPLDSYGAWDLQENRKLMDVEIETKKFNRIVTLDKAIK